MAWDDASPAATVYACLQQQSPGHLFRRDDTGIARTVEVEGRLIWCLLVGEFADT